MAKTKFERNILAMAVFLPLAACASFPPTGVADPRVELLAACRAANGTLGILSTMAASGKLSIDDIRRVDAVLPVLRDRCSAPPRGDLTLTYVAAINDAVAALIVLETEINARRN